MLVLLACLQIALPVVERVRPENVLVVVADDLGVDQLAVYGVGAELAVTPHLDALASEGVVFRNAYGNAYCSPTRAAILTGRHPFRTGIGTFLEPGDPTGFALPVEELLLPEMLDAGTGGRYRHGAFGKWHLGNASVGGPLAPNLAGFDRFAGIDGNITFPFTYHAWPKTVDGVPAPCGVYATTDTADEALAWIAATPEPWLAYVAFNAAHTPLNVPPDGTFEVDLSGAHAHTNPRPYYVAMIEAMDHEIGRLLAGVDAGRTHVIFVGDNGTPKGMTLPPVPAHQHKGTPYEGGIHVPLIVRGPAVVQPGRAVDALVQTTDVFATVAELARVDLAAAAAGRTLDSISFAPYLADPAQPPLRATAFTEIFEPNGPGPHTAAFQTVRDARYKLIQELGVEDRLYDLLLDPWETVNLLEGTPPPEALAAHADLAAAIAMVQGS